MIQDRLHVSSLKFLIVQVGTKSGATGTSIPLELAYTVDDESRVASTQWRSGEVNNSRGTTLGNEWIFSFGFGPSRTCPKELLRSGSVRGRRRARSRRYHVGRSLRTRHPPSRSLEQTGSVRIRRGNSEPGAGGMSQVRTALAERARSPARGAGRWGPEREGAL